MIKTTPILYETTYTDKHHFSFGDNWKDFLNNLNDDRIDQAKKSLLSFLGGNKYIKNKSFIDIGCGSGLFSLAAYILGASKIVSVDIDESSLRCTNYLRNLYHNPTKWLVVKGSALDVKLIKRLGTYDIVYSWGVLHHTGNMYQAIKYVSKLVSAKGLLYIAIYNKTSGLRQGGSSKFWSDIKFIYNSSNFVVKEVFLYIYAIYQILGLILIARKNPINYIRDYKKVRGMSWKHDLKDWLGGYPFEYATIKEITAYMNKLNFICTNLKQTRMTGCNEYLFKRV